MDTLSGFCMLLRKYLCNTNLLSVRQIEPERIVEMVFEAKDGKFLLFLEFFGKGNVIVCKEDMTIIDALTHHEFKDRNVAPKETYRHPQMGYNAFSVGEDDFASLFSSTGKDSLVKCLAIDLGLGGVYAEEVCGRAEVEKSAKPSEIGKKEQAAILGALGKITHGKIHPVIYLNEEKVEDVYPFSLLTFSEKKSREFQSFSEAIEHYAQNFSKERKTSYDARLAEISRIIGQQEKNIIELGSEEKDNREKAEMIYSNYMQVKSLLDELTAISKKHSWQKIKETLKGHPLIKEVNPQEKSVVLEIG